MKNIKIIALVSALVALNLLLLYLNTDLQSQIKNAELQQVSWGFEKTGETIASISHPDIKSPNSGLNLIVILTDEGCISCVENEIRNLNEYHKSFNDYLRVYIMSDDKTYLEQFDVNFPFQQIDPEYSVLDKKFDFNNPVALLTDTSGIVQDINIAEVGDPGKRNQFYERMISLFQSI